MSPGQIRRMQNKKLRAFIRYQIPFHPFYRRVFKKLGIDPSSIKRIEDLEKLPLTTKKDILPTEKNPEVYKDFILQPDEKTILSAWPMNRLLVMGMKKSFGVDVAEEFREEYAPSLIIATSGTTGNNVPFVYTQYDLEIFGRSFIRNALVGGITPESKALNLFPFAPHLAFYHTLIAALRGGWFVYHTGGGDVTSTEKAIDLARKLQVDTLIGIPSYLYHMVRKSVELHKPLSTITRIMGAGERFPEGSKKKIERMLVDMGSPGVDIIDVYGATEMRTAFTECRPLTQEFHTHPDLLITEIVDPKTGEQLGPGERGALAITSIDGRGSTVMRYLIGDIFEGGIVYDRCPRCSSPVPRLIGPIRRSHYYEETIHLTNIKGPL